MAPLGLGPTRSGDASQLFWFTLPRASERATIDPWGAHKAVAEARFGRLQWLAGGHIGQRMSDRLLSGRPFALVDKRPMNHPDVVEKQSLSD